MKIKLLLLFLIVSVNVMGQVPESNPEEIAKKKEINSLKRNGEAYYSDVYQELKVEDADMEAAQERSKEMLRAHVVEIFSKRMGMSKEDVREIWSVIEKNCQNIVVKKGDLFRVFTYVMKNALNPNALEESVDGAKENETVPAETTKPEKQAEVKVDTVAASVSSPVSVPVSEPKVEPKPEIKPEPKVEPKQEPKVEPKQEPKVEPKPEPASTPVPEVTIPELCQNIIAKENFDTIYRFLQQEKTYQRLMYGSAKTMQRPEKCYIVLTDKTTGALVAVLDKGQSDRMNFVTKKMDHFRNYKGGNYKAIFVQEY